MKKATLRRAALSLTLAAAMVSFTLWCGQMEATETFSPQLRAGYTLVIDPGHGGADGGAVSVSGVAESELNLAIALKCDQIAGLFGQRTVLLRDTEASLADPEAETVREQKRSDMENRVAVVNATPDALLLSIHQNQYTDSKYSGAQVFYQPDGESQGWAEQTQTLLRECLDSDNRRQAKEMPSDLYLMSHITCPAILAECGFLSNPEEDHLLQDDGYQTRLAAVLMGACLGYWYGSGQ
ncbi:MAG: N-acetylmuramoyl-L-alanine amidase [Clostridiales bacterium]|nr:N-acetylmuramoyl-L-alanine amidase [Clostridiales bacterium]